jgi:hypothetical protein
VAGRPGSPRGRPATALTATVSEVLDAIELRVAPETLRTLTRLAASVKEHLRVLHVGAMMARSDSGLRVCMRVTERSGVDRAVEALGCHGAADEIRKLQQDGAAHALTGMLLSFDVHETIGERVGVECVVQPAIPWDTRGYRALLDYLVGRGLCGPTKRDAILRMCDGRMPRIPYATRVRMLRCLSHFKILTAPGGCRSAKVYFYAFSLRGTPGIDGGTNPSQTCPSGELHATPA